MQNEAKTAEQNAEYVGDAEYRDSIRKAQEKQNQADAEENRDWREKLNLPAQ